MRHFQLNRPQKTPPPNPLVAAIKSMIYFYVGFQAVLILIAILTILAAASYHLFSNIF